jgi:hypothetical protein
MLLVPVFLGLSTTVSATEKYNEFGRLGYAYWDCAANGYLIEPSPSSVERLFELGYEKLGVFLQAGQDGELTEENTKDVPIGLSWYFVKGPNVDFSLGFMWAKFFDAAYDETWPEFEQPSFDAQRRIQKLKAMQAFQNKNCEILAK